LAIATDEFVIWAVDSLEKIPPDAPPGGGDRLQVESCRNEFTSGQLAVRAVRPLSDLRVSVSQLKHAESGAGGVEVTARFVGYVPVSRNTPDTPPEELIVTAPCLVADPLLIDETLSVDRDSTQPVWLTIFVPPDAPPGRWTGSAQVAAEGQKAEIPLELTVHPITLPAEQHLWVTNWMNVGNFAKFYDTERCSSRFWRVVESYAKNVAAHRQNVVLCSNDMIQIYQEPDGRLTFDYSDYDRWVEIFDRAGAAKLLEGGHLGRRGLGKWDIPWFEWRSLAVRRRDGAAVRLDPQTLTQQLCKSLHAHVRERGWLDRFVMHVVDEPASHTEEDYRKKSRLVHEWMPGVRFLEAMSLLDARQELDIWVPQLSHFDKHMENYLKMRDEAGIELWFYTCMYPTGRYPNRFLDFSLLKTRILHWINWRYGMTGYLHWGLNFWARDPFHQDRIRAGEEDDLPPGDCWIVYPGPDGPMDSVRWEQMREGIQDFELLRLLDQRAGEAGKSAGEADRICAALVPDPTSYTRSIADLRAARCAVVDALAVLDT
jgi:hypothetical protein